MAPPKTNHRQTESVPVMGHRRLTVPQRHIRNSETFFVHILSFWCEVLQLINALCFIDESAVSDSSDVVCWCQRRWSAGRLRCQRSATVTTHEWLILTRPLSTVMESATFVRPLIALTVCYAAALNNIASAMLHSARSATAALSSSVLFVNKCDVLHFESSRSRFLAMSINLY